MHAGSPPGVSTHLSQARVCGRIKQMEALLHVVENADRQVVFFRSIDFSEHNLFLKKNILSRNSLAMYSSQWHLVPLVGKWM